MWVYVLIVPMKDDSVLDSHSLRNTWGFVYLGLERYSPHKLFQGIQYFHYVIFAFFLVIFYDNRTVQILIPLIALFLLVVFVVALKPANTPFWKSEQIGIHILLLIAKVLFSVLVFDDETEKMSGRSRWILGYFVAIFIFLVILWNTLVLLWRLWDHYSQCNQLALNPTIPVTVGNTVGQLRLDDDYEVV